MSQKSSGSFSSPVLSDDNGGNNYAISGSESSPVLSDEPDAVIPPTATPKDNQIVRGTPFSARAAFATPFPIAAPSAANSITKTTKKGDDDDLFDGELDLSFFDNPTPKVPAASASTAAASAYPRSLLHLSPNPQPLLRLPIEKDDGEKLNPATASAAASSAFDEEALNLNAEALDLFLMQNPDMLERFDDSIFHPIPGISPDKYNTPIDVEKMRAARTEANRLKGGFHGAGIYEKHTPEAKEKLRSFLYPPAAASEPIAATASVVPVPPVIPRQGRIRQTPSRPAIAPLGDRLAERLDLSHAATTKVALEDKDNILTIKKAKASQAFTAEASLGKS